MVKGRAVLAALLLASCGGSKEPPSFPEACPACPKDKEDTSETFASDGLLGVNWGELNMRAETHATLTNGDPHLRSGLGLEFDAAFTRNDRVRAIFFHDWTFGAWGDQQHGNAMWENGAGLKVSFVGDLTLIDVYALGTGSVITGFGGTPSGSPAWGTIVGGGIGARIFRSFGMELTSHELHSLDALFVANNGSTTRELIDFGLAVTFDTCAWGWCKRGPLRQTSRDVTCAIYDDAKDVCRASKDRAALCKKARSAMELTDDKPSVLARDAVARFLNDIGEQALIKTHGCLTQWRSCGRQKECQLAQRAETVKTRRAYSPYVIELLAALGCNADGSVTSDATGAPAPCNYACEVTVDDRPSCP